MIVVMRSDASRADLDGVVKRLEARGLGTHLVLGEERTVVGVIGTRFTPELAEVLENLPSVDHVARITKPYKLASREFRPINTVVQVGDLRIGADELVVMAGPCSVESREQLLATARAVKLAGARVLRGGAYKPRTSPYSFQGLGLAGLELLAEARAETGLPIITEVLEPGDVETVSHYADILQIGARNMQNFPLLREAGRSERPVMVKRGLSGTIEEWLMAAEYVMDAGNFNVILCERGIRTFETAARNTFDLAAVPILRGMTHLPIIADPSHATGKWKLVKPMAMAAVAAGADGLIIEVHPNPDEALSDGPQSLNFESFQDMMDGVRRVAEVVGRWVAPELEAVGV